MLLNRLDDVFEHEPEQGHDRSRLRPVRSLTGHVAFRNVGFRYGGPEAPAILEDITLEVPAGKTVAIVGRSGSGKTTLAKCLAGLLEPTEGTILFDGLDLKTLNYRDLRRQIGFVLQDAYVFADTIARNIAFGEDEPDMERVRLGGAGGQRATSSSSGCRSATTRGSARPASRSRADRSSGSRSPGRCTTSRRSWSSTRPPARSTPNRNDRCSRTSTACCAAAPRSSSRIGLSTVRSADMIIVLERGKLVEQRHARRADAAPGPLLLPREPATGGRYVTDHAPALR